MVNIYPYFAYSSDPAHISLDYASFRSQTPVVMDGPFKYFNLFDAQVDAYYAALEKINAGICALYMYITSVSALFSSFFFFFLQ